MENNQSAFKPYISATDNVAEFTVKSILLGAIFGILFGMSTVYLALKAGLTVSASIPGNAFPITWAEALLHATRKNRGSIIFFIRLVFTE